MNRAGHCWRCETLCTQRCPPCRVAFYCSKKCQKQDKWRHQPNCDAAALKRQCMGCGKEDEGMLRCTNCQRAWFCNAVCQRKGWGNHKKQCHEIVMKTIQVATKIKAVHAHIQQFPGMPVNYYWDNLPAVDLLNLSMNEGEEYSNPLALLLCGVGDPRNVLLTIDSLPDVYEQQVDFVLNDICPCTLARTVLLLYMLYKGGNDIFGAVVRIWYSVCITEEDFTLLTSALQDLSTTAELRTLTEGVMDLSADQLSQLKIVWATWLRLSERKGPWVAELRKMRNSSEPQREDGISHYMQTIPTEHRISARHRFDTGIFHSTTNFEELTRQNPTLTGRGCHPCTANVDFHYSIPPDVLPFTGWDYKVIKKNYYADSLPKMYTIYLSKILQKSLEKVTSGQVKFHFILCNALEIEKFLPAAVRYDRITTSNLWDYYHLANLLTKFKGLLNNINPHAVILTQAQNWPRDLMPEIVHELPYSYGIDDLRERALKDTQNPELVESSGLSTIVEYQNLTHEFLMFLRASLLVSYSENELASFKRKKKIPSVKSLVDSLGLHLRDFIRNENTVSPFKWALNCRRVVMLRGYERALEWKLTSDSAAEPAVE